MAIDMEYDYIIVGAGFFGSICARELTDAGKKCLVIDRRTHVGGNCYTSNKGGIHVHEYGPHIFHTDDEDVWKYINRFATFNTSNIMEWRRLIGSYTHCHSTCGRFIKSMGRQCQLEPK